VAVSGERDEARYTPSVTHYLQLEQKAGQNFVTLVG
jgi:hypothetical protein